MPKEGSNLNIYVANLAREVTEEELRRTFEPFGRVAAVRIVTDRYSGVSRGLGFVEMSDKAEAQAAIEGLNMEELAGPTLDVSEAHPPPYRRKGQKALWWWWRGQVGPWRGAGQVGIDGDPSKLPRHHSQKVGASSRAPSPSENPMGKCLLSSWASEA